jgi:hypothetical protein
VSPSHPSRRSYLAGAAVVVAAGLAGCGGSPGASDEPGDGADEDGADRTTAADSPPVETTVDDDDGDGSGDSDDLDLREANVVGVTLERDVGDDASVRFDVTLLHDDDGEDGYANWWQVETVDGERLGRRDLSHAHGTQAFTRSETVDVPDGVSTVAVRGHDQTHGYGGQAALVDVESGDIEFVRQGPQRQAVGGSD